MILLATYPDAFRDAQPGEKIASTFSFIDRFFSEHVGVHILPFFPNSGDGGFAADSIFRVEPELGNWDDLIPVFKKRPCFIDGIYNHVGNGSPFADQLFSQPEIGAEIFHAFPASTELRSPMSPRGQPMLAKELINGELWQIWRTFNQFAIDLNLDNPAISALVEEHMRFVRSLGVSGLRLDAISYYGKEFGDKPRHTPSSHRLAISIAKRCLANDLEVLAQLDSDEPALEYFGESPELNVSLIDYGYCPKLLYGLISEDFSFLSKHLQTHRGGGQRIVRSPRTHDGVLLRSKNISAEFTSVFWRTAQANRYHCRTIGSPYEINDPLSSILANGRGERFWNRLYLAIAITYISSDICYLYLPAVLGFSADESDSPDEDPRALNRARIPLDFLSDPSSHEGIQNVIQLVNNLSSVRSIDPNDRVADGLRVRQLDAHVYEISSDVLAQSLVFNGSGEDVTFGETLGPVLVSYGLSEQQLKPHGFVLYKN